MIIRTKEGNIMQLSPVMFDISMEKKDNNEVYVIFYSRFIDGWKHYTFCESAYQAKELLNDIWIAMTLNQNLFDIKIWFDTRGIKSNV